MTKLVVLALALAACSDDETNNPTPDASAPPHPDAAPPIDSAPKVCSASDPSSCSGETICIGTMCEPAFNRIYTFSGISVTVASKNPGGSAWDPLGGAPDPFVEIKLNGMSVLKTKNVSDVFSATYTESTDQQIVAGSKLELTLSDADVGGDDLILDCVADPLTADELRHAALQCDGSGPTAGSQIVIRIDVKG